jgi:outer membrane protein TolC
MLTVLSPSCTRVFFRDRADKEVSEVISDKNTDHAWSVLDHNPYPDPKARFADPTDPDHPPMPEDDPAAWQLSPKPQKPKKIASIEGAGYLDLLAGWDDENRGRMYDLLNPDDQELMGGGPEGMSQDCAIDAHRPADCIVHRREPYLLKVEQALELASFNSRDFQTQREDLYLAALPVTLERFAFAPQFEAINQTLRRWAGPESSVGKQNTWEANSTLGVQKAFATGALLLLQLSNQTVVNMTGDNKGTISESTLLLNLTQPLLKGGGRAVNLEPLTQAERDLLYQLRDFARYHEEFFVNTVAGGGSVGGTTRITGTVPAAVGYYPTVLQLQELRNEQQNERDFARTLRYFQALAGGGGLSRLQVDQVQQAYLQARASVLQRQQTYADSIDQFKIQLGLPTEVPLVLDDGVIEPLTSQMRRIEKLETTYNAILDEIRKLGAQKFADKELRDALVKLVETGELLEGTKLRQEFKKRLESWQKLDADALKKKLDTLRPQRAELRDEINRLDAEQKPVPPDLAERFRVVTLEIDLGLLENMLRAHEAQPKNPDLVRKVINEFSPLMAVARHERVEFIKKQWPKLPPVCVNGVELLNTADQDEVTAQALAGRVALNNRLDLMNQRAQVADAWRKIAVTANGLLGTFNVQYNMESITPRGQAKPFAFSGSRTQHQLIFNTELPLVRKLERNLYRSSLIEYQRQRRNLMLAEDQVLFQVRQDLRQMQQLAENFRIQQVNLELAYTQVTLASEEFRKPAAPGDDTEAAATAAALTRQLLDAQQSVPQAQDALFAAWIGYLTTRMAFYRDLELMRMDSRGVWIDEFATPDCSITDQCGPYDPLVSHPATERPGVPIVGPR